MARSVVRLADQNAGRFPDRCVLSGVATDRAVRCSAVRWNGPRWLLGVPGAVPLLGTLPGRARATVSLPVSKKVWSIWNRRNVAALLILVFGLGLIVAGAVRQTGILFGVGLVVFFAAAVYRARAHHNFWTSCRLNDTGDSVIVEPTHPDFDRQARQLFERSLRR